MTTIGRLCTHCKVRPVAYPASKTSNWCKVCLEEVRKARYDPVVIRDKNLQQNISQYVKEEQP